MSSCSIALVDKVGKEILALSEFASELSDKVMAVNCKILDKISTQCQIGELSAVKATSGCEKTACERATYQSAKMRKTPKMWNGTECDLTKGNPKYIFGCDYIHTPYLTKGNPKR
jgi:ABC-type dipeptide/oligopeptide/nickel transport system ATPase subunit